MSDDSTTTTSTKTATTVSTIKQFKSQRSQPVEFEVDGDKFYAVAVIPAEDFGRIAELQGHLTPQEGSTDTNLDTGETIRTLLEIVELMMLPDSVELLAERLRSKTNPLAVETIVEIIAWLMNENYGDSKDGDSRPTQPTSD